MIRLFSLPIILGIILGIAFPFQSLSLIWMSSFLMIGMLFANGLTIQQTTLRPAGESLWEHSTVSIFLLFVFYPLAQTAIASLFLQNQDNLFGYLISSLAPSAIVVPFFLGHRKGDARKGLITVIASTLLVPFVIPVFLKLFGFSQIYMKPQALFLYLSLLILIPVALSWATLRFLPFAARRIQSYLPSLNAFCLGALMFILVGSSLNRAHYRNWWNQDLILLVFLFIWMDFGVYLVTRSLAKLFLDKIAAETLAVSVSARNYALPASLLLFFDPKSALPAAIGLVVHAFFFQWLLLQRKAETALDQA